MSDTTLKPLIGSTITYTHPQAGHANVVAALRNAGLECELPSGRFDQVRVHVHRNIPVEDMEPKANQAIASAFRAMGINVSVESSAR